MSVRVRSFQYFDSLQNQINTNTTPHPYMGSFFIFSKILRLSIGGYLLVVPYNKMLIGFTVFVTLVVMERK